MEVRLFWLILGVVVGSAVERWRRKGCPGADTPPTSGC